MNAFLPLPARLPAIIALSAILLGGPIRAFAGSLHRAEIKGLRSYDENVEAEVTFTNGSGQTIKVYWIDFSGDRVLYMTLKNGEAYTQKTYLTHPWLITDENDNAWSVHFPDAEPRKVEIAPRKK